MSGNEYSFYVEQGCKALGKIKDPSTVKYLTQVLNNGSDRDDSYAAFALKDMGPIAREAVPMLIDSLKTCDSSCWSITKALGAIGDEAAIPALLQFVLENPNQKSYNVRSSARSDAILALKAIGTDSAVEALKEILLGKGELKEDNSYLSLRTTALDSLWELRGEQENSFFCSLKEKDDIGNLEFYLKDKCKENLK